jgi:hypothetical protein
VCSSDFVVVLGSSKPHNVRNFDLSWFSLSFFPYVVVVVVCVLTHFKGFRHVLSVRFKLFKENKKNHLFLVVSCFKQS